MNYTVSIAVDDVINALIAFLQPFVGDAQIIRAEVNRTAEPPNPYVKLTEILSVDLETPVTANATGTSVQPLLITGPTRIDIQADFYGQIAGDYAKAVKTVFRTPYTASMFPDGIKPLYCSDANQGPLITGEQQYEQRWTLTVSLQYNPVVAIPQQSAIELGPLNIFEDIP